MIDSSRRHRCTRAAAVIVALVLVSCSDAEREAEPTDRGTNLLAVALEQTDARLRGSHRAQYEELQQDGQLIHIRTSLEPIPTAIGSAVSMCEAAAEIIRDSYLVAVHARTGRVLSLSVNERCKRVHLKARTTLWHIPAHQPPP